MQRRTCCSNVKQKIKWYKIIYILAISHLLQVVGQLDPDISYKINSNSLHGLYGKSLIRNGIYCSLSYNDMINV